ncbi:MAG: DUF3943 domain-containing protein [Bacteroides sp.]|nr:DUF3943 domain-containing protein [Bacteroides sp.]
MRRLMRTIMLWMGLLTLPPGHAQMAMRHSLHTPLAADSADVAYYGRKHGVRAAAMVFGINMGVWAFDRYARKADFAYISGATIRRNFRHGFVWDNDGMGTNMFMHPYHGNLYFNAARSNGYSYWHSSLFAFGGSFMWEMAMENEYPSTNDILATPIGGMALGEVTYRMSDLILDDRRTGRQRLGLEAASFLVSPMRGVTRLLSGDAWRRRKTSGKQFGVPDISVDLSAGVRVLELRDDILDKGWGIATEVSMEYGDRFDADGKKPYDYFTMKARLNLQESQPVLGQLNITGRLIGGEAIDTEKHYLSVGLYQHFDYYDSDTISDVSNRTPYKFCTPASFGSGFVYKWKGGGVWDVDGQAHVNLILLGATLSDHYKLVDRNYNLASGYSSKFALNLTYRKDLAALSAGYEIYHMFTWKGYPYGMDWESADPRTLNAQGDRSNAILHATELRLDLKLRRRLYLTASLSNYTRKTEYRYYEDVSSSTFEGRLMLTWKL